MKRKPSDEGLIMHIILLKYAGFFILGILPIVIFLQIVPQYSWRLLGLAISSKILVSTLLWVLGISVPMVLLLKHTARKPKNCEHYPQIRVAAWDIDLILRYSFAWTVYLLGYEMLFRGLLLFPLVDALGVWPAIAIGTCMYAVSHLPKGPLETFCSFLFGPLFCYITLQTGAIWASWLIHSVLAIANSMIALKHHPTFFLVRNRRPMVSDTDF